AGDDLGPGQQAAGALLGELEAAGPVGVVERRVVAGGGAGGPHGVLRDPGADPGDGLHVVRSCVVGAPAPVASPHGGSGHRCYEAALLVGVAPDPPAGGHGQGRAPGTPPPLDPQHPGRGVPERGTAAEFAATGPSVISGRRRRAGGASTGRGPGCRTGASGPSGCGACPPTGPAGTGR